MKLSVIIPCYNAARTIADQLDALASQQCSEPWEILIVNNRSTDNTVEIVEGYSQRLPNLRITEARLQKSSLQVENYQDMFLFLPCLNVQTHHQTKVIFPLK